MVKMNCDDIHCWKLLLDLEGTRHNSVLHILLRLYSYYFIGCPIYKSQERSEQYWALDPDNRVQTVSKIAASFGVPHQTLDNRIKGKHKPAWKSQGPKQHLSKAEEAVLVDWIQYHSETARPLSHRTLTKKVSQACGKTVGKRWYLQFIA